MLWFKHAHDFRNSPAMKQIQRRLGDSGFAAAIRLIEVMTYRSGTGTKFNPILTLAPPQSELWLAHEILSWDETTDTEEDLCAELTRFLNEFSIAGLIVCQHADGRRPVQSAEGVWSEQSCKWLTIQLVEFEEFMDVWTARKVKDAQRRAE
jgi:hypothetical protein